MTDAAERARHTNPFVRASAASATFVPEDVVELLANDRSAAVRMAAASSRATTGALLSQLADDDDELVRRRVALNPNTPPGVLAELAAHDTDGCVRVSAVALIDPPERLDAVTWDRIADELISELEMTPTDQEARPDAAEGELI